MLAELVTGALLVLKEPTPLLIINIIAILAIWLVTFLISMPCHKVLSEKKDKFQIERLIKTNWIRTILWTIRSVLILMLVLKGVK